MPDMTFFILCVSQIRSFKKELKAKITDPNNSINKAKITESTVRSFLCEICSASILNSTIGRLNCCSPHLSDTRSPHDCTFSKGAASQRAATLWLRTPSPVMNNSMTASFKNSIKAVVIGKGSYKKQCHKPSQSHQQTFLRTSVSTCGLYRKLCAETWWDGAPT